MKRIFLLLAVAISTTSAFASSPATEKLPSGVVVSHVTDGTGAQAKASDTVKVNYRGTLADGTEFDNSVKHGGPATFPLNHVIPCFSEGIATMHVGGKAKLSCPAATAYGNHAVGSIPANSDLTFEVELVDIVK